MMNKEKSYFKYRDLKNFQRLNDKHLKNGMVVERYEVTEQNQTGVRKNPKKITKYDINTYGKPVKVEIQIASYEYKKGDICNVPFKTFEGAYSAEFKMCALQEYTNYHEVYSDAKFRKKFSMTHDEKMPLWKKIEGFAHDLGQLPCLENKKIQKIWLVMAEHNGNPLVVVVSCNDPDYYVIGMIPVEPIENMASRLKELLYRPNDITHICLNYSDGLYKELKKEFPQAKLVIDNASIVYCLQEIKRCSKLEWLSEKTQELLDKYKTFMDMYRADSSNLMSNYASLNNDLREYLTGIIFYRMQIQDDDTRKGLDAVFYETEYIEKILREIDDAEILAQFQPENKCFRENVPKKIYILMDNIVQSCKRITQERFQFHMIYKGQNLLNIKRVAEESGQIKPMWRYEAFNAADLTKTPIYALDMDCIGDAMDEVYEDLNTDAIIEEISGNLIRVKLKINVYMNKKLQYVEILTVTKQKSITYLRYDSNRKEVDRKHYYAKEENALDDFFRTANTVDWCVPVDYDESHWIIEYSFDNRPDWTESRNFFHQETAYFKDNSLLDWFEGAIFKKDMDSVDDFD